MNLRKQKVSSVTQLDTSGGKYNFTIGMHHQCLTLQTYCGNACQTTLLTNQTGCCELSRLAC
ncbi:hypothetical protein [Kordia sp.]|uniref:hypothetical protein n=1 Tax=Kordia sp. TaxID=1965332 RepID=UPI003D2BE9BE